ncbi:MAG: lipopolysaccharide kinase InaA family protein [Nitrospirota bacterium]
MQTTGKNSAAGEMVKMTPGKGASLSILFAEKCDRDWLQEKIPFLLSRKEGMQMKSSQFSNVLRFQHPETGEFFYFKEYLNRGIKDKLMKLLGVARSQRAYRAGWMLLEKGFLTPVPVAHGIEKTCCLVRRNFLITKGVPGERTYQYFQAHFPLPVTAQIVAEKRSLLEAAGHAIGRLHGMGICHGDLRVGNIIISGTGSAAEFFFIDNERTRAYLTIPERERLKNLVQLNMVLLPHITRTDRLRFFNAYVMENPGLLSRKRGLIHEIIRMTRKRHVRKVRR